MSTQEKEQNPLPQSGSRHPLPRSQTRTIIWNIIFAVGLALVFVFEDRLPNWPWNDKLPNDPLEAAKTLLEAAPVIDGHVDLPMLLRYSYANNGSAIDLNSQMPGHIDIPRLREGHVGGFFWSVYFECATEEDEGPDFINATWLVRDTLEQIDISSHLIDKYPNTFQLALGSADIRTAFKSGKVASLLGVEGAHQLGNSLAVLRQYHALGVRYVTLTHVCHNAFADSCGFLKESKPLHNGLSHFGRTLIQEMNRLGVLVDLSHTSDATAAQALKLSRAPVIFSHSAARALHDVARNIPDDILSLIGESEGKTDAVVMVNFVPFFLAPPGNATVAIVADHVEHISKVTGKKHVGLGSDYDGIEETPLGLDDASKFPALIAELYSRGWSRSELEGLTCRNFLRVFEGSERVAREMKAEGATAAFDLYEKRPDLPASKGVAEILAGFDK